MRQIKITSDDLVLPSENDCYLSPDDPIQQLREAGPFALAFGTEAALQYHASFQKTPIVGSTKGQEQREQGIEPGTDAWFKHWFSKNK